MLKHSDFKTYLTAYHNEVTGSRLLLVIMTPEGRTYRLLVDCGYYQEVEYRPMNYVDDLDPTQIDAILITHNHIDHTGLLPKMVKQGYKNPIYMTEITEELIPKFLLDSADQQEENAKYLRDKFKDEEGKFKALYHREDVGRTLNLCEGLPYNQTTEIFPGIKVTFLVNGHILGAAMILIQCTSYGRKPINILFTGDYKLTNTFFDVPEIPEWVRELDLIMVHESTYGTTTSEEIKVCFARNLLEGFKRNQNILIGAFAQGRMQEILYDLKKLQDVRLIPENYGIYVDGPLGIDTTRKYAKILKWFSPSASNFIPRDVSIVNQEARTSILNSSERKILVTTSGMLSNGPARIYVPIFLENDNAMIHLTGYAAEETLARTLLEAKRADYITIGGRKYQKKAFVKTTREKTSHATLDEMLLFISQFANIEFMAINHGEEDVKDGLQSTVEEECANVQLVDVLDRQYMYCIYQFGFEGDQFSNIVVKKMPAKLSNLYTPEDRKKMKEHHKEKREKKDIKRAAKRKAKARRK